MSQVEKDGLVPCPCCEGTGRSDFMDDLRKQGMHEVHDALIHDSYRAPGNPTERRVHESLLANGAVVLRRGWPDFLVIEGRKIYTVEVKREADEYRPTQKAVGLILASFGIDSYLYRERDGANHVFHPQGDSNSWKERGILKYGQEEA